MSNTKATPTMQPSELIQRAKAKHEEFEVTSQEVSDECRGDGSHNGNSDGNGDISSITGRFNLRRLKDYVRETQARYNSSHNLTDAERQRRRFARGQMMRARRWPSRHLRKQRKEIYKSAEMLKAREELLKEGDLKVIGMTSRGDRVPAIRVADPSFATFDPNSSEAAARVEKLVQRMRRTSVSPTQMRKSEAQSSVEAKWKGDDEKDDEDESMVQ